MRPPQRGFLAVLGFDPVDKGLKKRSITSPSRSGQDNTHLQEQRRRTVPSRFPTSLQIPISPPHQQRIIKKGSPKKDTRHKTQKTHVAQIRITAPNLRTEIVVERHPPEPVVFVLARRVEFGPERVGGLEGGEGGERDNGTSWKKRDVGLVGWEDSEAGWIKVVVETYGEYTREDFAQRNLHRPACENKNRGNRTSVRRGHTKSKKNWQWLLTQSKSRRRPTCGVCTT